VERIEQRRGILVIHKITVKLTRELYGIGKGIKENNQMKFLNIENAIRVGIYTIYNLGELSVYPGIQ
jgi:hypothetical protein